MNPRKELAIKFRFAIAVFAIVLSIAEVVSADCKSKGQPTFEQYPATELFRAKPHAPVLRTRLDHIFRTAIREAVADGTNFAGHYVLASWGCGSGCMQFVVVNAVSGDVTDPPFRAVYFHYSHHANKKWPDFDATGRWWCDENDLVTGRLDSRMLVVEGCVEHPTIRCGRTYFEMTSGGLKQLWFDPDLLPDGTVAKPGMPVPVGQRR
jgi:hypothetical protein